MATERNNKEERAYRFISPDSFTGVDAEEMEKLEQEDEEEEQD